MTVVTKQLNGQYWQDSNCSITIFFTCPTCEMEHLKAGNIVGQMRQLIEDILQEFVWKYFQYLLGFHVPSSAGPFPSEVAL